MRRLVLLMCLSSLTWAESPDLGQEIPDEDVRSITVFSDGTGLPTGSGTVAEGKSLYEINCLRCHGPTAQEGPNDALAGDKARTLGSYWPYAPTIFDYVRRTMPYEMPGYLSDDQIYSVVAYLLHLNGLLDADASLDAASLSVVELPNRPKFYSEYDLP